MRFTLYLFFLFLLQTSASNGYSQDTRLSLDLKNTTINEALTVIEQQTPYFFLFNNALIDVNRIVTIQCKDEKIESVLDGLFKGTSVEYIIKNRQIILTNQFVSQRIRISGKVTDSSGMPLPGVTITVKGTMTGTITDVDGNYNLTNVPEDATLIFSFVGMKMQEIAMEGRSVLNVAMEEEAIGLEEVVAIGYGIQKKVSLTGSISQVNAEKLKENPLGNISQALYGAAPGVEVYVNNQPGSDAKIRIHGLGTINNNSPLWVIDGVPGGNINQLNPSNVQSISILKDAASTAIYGARGANGVILVSTKEGKKEQPPHVEIDLRYGTARNTSKYDLLGVEEYGEMIWLEAANSGVDPVHPVYGSGEKYKIPRYLYPTGVDNTDLSLYDAAKNPITEANAKGTDWFDEILQSGITKEMNISINGGSKNTVYSFDAGVLEEEGIMIHTGFRRYTVGGRIKSNVNKWLEIGQNIGVSLATAWGLQTQGETSQLGFAMQLPAIMPVYDIMGNYAPTSRITGFDTMENPVADLERAKDYDREDLGVRGNTYLNISLSKNLSFKSLLGYVVERDHDKYPLEANPESYNARSENQLTETYSEYLQYNFTNTLNYSTLLADIHRFEILLGTEAINRDNKTFSASRDGFLLTNEDYWVLNAGEGTQTNSGSDSDWATLSYFGRLHYELDSKYLLDATFRRDGSSRFGKNSRYGNFASVAMAWRISEEKFMAPTKDWLDSFKVRVSWGQSGNDQVGEYNGFTYYSPGLNFSYYPISGSNNSMTTGYQSTAFGNPDAKWETTTSKTIGLDARLFKRIDLIVDVWQRDTKDMLYQKGIPAVVGYATSPSVNVGDMRNRGFDIQVNFHGSALTEKLKYNISLNVSHYKNEIVRLSDRNNEVLLGSLVRSQRYVQSEIGTSFPEFYGYDVLGIFQTEEEASGYAPQFEGSYNKPGNFKFRDVSRDGVIDSDDRTYIGSPHPDFTSGLTLNVQYKHLDLTANFYAGVGNDIANIMRRSIDFYPQRNHSKRRLYESWGSPYLKSNADAKMPVAKMNDSYSQLPSSYFIEDGSYLRLQSLQLGYDLPSQILGKNIFDQLRIYFLATNLFTITKYSGLDPQLQTSDSDFGMDAGIWPMPKRYTIGFNIGF